MLEPREHLTREKIQLYQAIVLPKLMYNLESLWINADGLCRLNAFHARCLRHICRIQPSFISKVNNEEVYERSGETLLSTFLHKVQVKLYTKIAQLPWDDIMRKLTCEPNSNRAKVWDYNRKRGRPKHQWTPSFFKLAVATGHIAL